MKHLLMIVSGLFVISTFTTSCSKDNDFMTQTKESVAQKPQKPLVAVDVEDRPRTIKGKIKSVNANPISGATVVLCSPIDSSDITNTSTDSNGDYEIDDILPGNYYLRVEASGFITTYKSFGFVNDPDQGEYIVEDVTMIEE